MIGNTTIDQVNAENFVEMVKTLDPDLFMIKVALEETRVNPQILPSIIRSLGNLSIGTGYGKVQIFVQGNTVTQIKGEESVQIEQSVVLVEDLMR